MVINVTAFVFDIKEILQDKCNMDDFEEAARMLRASLDRVIDEERENKINQGSF